MRELSLFTGAGGGVLGTMLAGSIPIGYVEWDEYCQRVIAARIRDGIYPEAPIFTDVREFVQSGAARQYRGFADVVTAGFPCQPFSVAGARSGADDPRNMWPATAEVIRAVRPQTFFGENVPGLISSGYFGVILRDLAEMGYAVRWGVLGASDVGANHRRKRLWILANAGSSGRDARDACEQGNYRRTPGQGEAIITPEPGQTPASLADTEIPRLEGHRHSAAVAGEGHGERHTGAEACPNGTWWESEPRLDRVVDGVANRVNRLKAIGNGQVPLVAKTAWEVLT